MTRLNYGKRFSNCGVSAKVGYDERIDRDMRENYNIFVGLAQQPLHKRELRVHKSVLACKKAAAKRAPGPEREDSEQRMAEAVRKCVQILEFHMEDMIQHRKVQGRPHYCTQQPIHNVIVELRHKCGVKFDQINPQYIERQCETTRRRDAHEIAEQNHVEREQQRLSRLRNMKEQAERFIKKHRQP